MPEFTRIDADYQPQGKARVWSQGSKTYSWRQRGKLSSPDSARQTQFERELLILSEALGSDDVPVYVSWRNAPRRRMDWGNIGHAVASGFLEEPEDNGQGFVSQVRLRRR